jgi:death-on-curing protein
VTNVVVPIYLTLDEILQVHERVLAEDGGMEGVRSHHGLASAAAQPEQTVFGEDAYPTIPEKAAAYAFFIAMGHPFNDGNKRTAVLALEVFLEINGFELRQPDEDIEEMMVSLASGVIGQGEFFGWVCNHARPVDRRNVSEFPKP